MFFRLRLCPVDVRGKDVRYVFLPYIYRYDSVVDCHNLHCTGHQRFTLLVGNGTCQFTTGEFAKFATALVLAKYMSAYSFNIGKMKNMLMLALFILLPMGLIIRQRETGSAFSLFGILSHVV